MGFQRPHFLVVFLLSQVVFQETNKGCSESLNVEDDCTFSELISLEKETGKYFCQKVFVKVENCKKHVKEVYPKEKYNRMLNILDNLFRFGCSQSYVTPKITGAAECLQVMSCFTAFVLHPDLTNCEAIKSCALNSLKSCHERMEIVSIIAQGCLEENKVKRTPGSQFPMHGEKDFNETVKDFRDLINNSKGKERDEEQEIMNEDSFGIESHQIDDSEEMEEIMNEDLEIESHEGNMEEEEKFLDVEHSGGNMEQDEPDADGFPEEDVEIPFVKEDGGRLTVTEKAQDRMNPSLEREQKKWNEEEAEASLNVEAPQTNWDQYYEEANKDPNEFVEDVQINPEQNFDISLNDLSNTDSVKQPSQKRGRKIKIKVSTDDELSTIGEFTPPPVVSLQTARSEVNTPLLLMMLAALLFREYRTCGIFTIPTNFNFEG